MEPGDLPKLTIHGPSPLDGPPLPPPPAKSGPGTSDNVERARSLTTPAEVARQQVARDGTRAEARRAGWPLEQLAQHTTLQRPMDMAAALGDEMLGEGIVGVCVLGALKVIWTLLFGKNKRS